MLLPSTGISGLVFDPHLRDIHGADVVNDREGIYRALAALHRHDVQVAYRDRVEVGRLYQPNGVRITGRCRIEVGDTVSISDRQGSRHVGVRATVADIVHGDNGTAVRINPPSFAVFSPGRRHMRVRGALGAEVTLDVAGKRLTTTPRDLSISGVGVTLDEFFPLNVGDRAQVNMDFVEERVCLAAIVRRTVLDAEGCSLGLEFDRQDPRIARLLEESMTAH